MSDVHSDVPDCVYTDKNSGSSSETEQDISYPCYRKELHIKVTGNKAETNMEEQQHSHCICVFRWKVTARRTGKATITAKVGKKNYKCNVTVTPDYNQIYYKYLASHHKDIRWYYILNVDKTGAPEMITTSSGGGTTSYNVYTISGSKVVLAGSYGAKGISMSPPTISYVSKYKCLYADGWTNFIGGTWANMYGMSAKKLVLKYHAREAIPITMAGQTAVQREYPKLHI